MSKITNLFDEIRKGLDDNQNRNNSFRDLLKIETGKTYIVRFIPNLNKPSKSIFHYYSHGWRSLATGQYVDSGISPSTYGERCPITEERLKIYNNGSPEENEKAKALDRRENWMVNVYVIQDPTNPENEGKIKVLKYGRQLNKIIRAAIDGEDSDEFGYRIFDISEEGCNFRIKREPIGEDAKPWQVTYNSSKFLRPSKIDGMTKDKIKELHENIFDLEKMEPYKSYDELRKMVDEHFYCKSPTSNKTESKPLNDSPEKDFASITNDDFNWEDETKEESNDSNKKKKVEDTDDSGDINVDDILKEFEE